MGNSVQGQDTDHLPFQLRDKTVGMLLPCQAYSFTYQEAAPERQKILSHQI